MRQRRDNINCGHGEKDSLLGLGTYGSPPERATTRSSFFNQSHVPIGPKFLLASCSSAATELGKSYRDLTKGCTFVGFEDEIGLVLAGGIYDDWWKRIVHGVASSMLSAPNVQALEKSVLDLYKEALLFFSGDDGQKHKWELMMRAYLRSLMDSINFIQT